MCRNNLKVFFLNFCKGFKKLSLTLFVHWNVGKNSDHILIVALAIRKSELVLYLLKVHSDLHTSVVLWSFQLFDSIQ